MILVVSGLRVILNLFAIHINIVQSLVADLLPILATALTGTAPIHIAVIMVVIRPNLISL